MNAESECAVGALDRPTATSLDFRFHMNENLIRNFLCVKCKQIRVASEVSLTPQFWREIRQEIHQVPEPYGGRRKKRRRHGRGTFASPTWLK